MRLKDYVVNGMFSVRTVPVLSDNYSYVIQDLNLSKIFHISSAVPSKKRPQPPRNSESPRKMASGVPFSPVMTKQTLLPKIGFTV